MSNSQPFETQIVEHEEVACDGEAGALGHPRVFLHIDRTVGSVTCPYCSRQFVLKDGAHRVA
ncbi:MAG: zinc-finger domain-containing protein [Alphaproteobacteria bacterium]|nr:zinc-finger domain-containing protein [Alphaproteobacteria bacterium]